MLFDTSKGRENLIIAAMLVWEFFFFCMFEKQSLLAEANIYAPLGGHTPLCCWAVVFRFWPRKGENDEKCSHKKNYLCHNMEGNCMWQQGSNVHFVSNN